MVPYSFFVHPEDQEALNAMKSFPGFEVIVKEVLKVGWEEMLHGVTKITEPLRLAMYWWERKSELSAGRVAAAVCGKDTFIRTELRLAGGPKELTNRVNIEQWARQAEEYGNIASVLSGSTHICTNCHYSVSDSWDFCKYCGERLK